MCQNTYRSVSGSWSGDTNAAATMYADNEAAMAFLQPIPPPGYRQPMGYSGS